MSGWLAKKCKRVPLCKWKVVRESTKSWNVTPEWHGWSVQPDVSDLGAHLDTTFVPFLLPESGRWSLGVAAAGALPLRFRVKFGVIRPRFSRQVCMVLKVRMFLP